MGIPQGFPRRSVLDSLPLTDFVGLVGTLVAFATSGCRPDEPYKGETGVVGNPPTLSSASPCVLTLSTLLVVYSSTLTLRTNTDTVMSAFNRIKAHRLDSAGIDTAESMSDEETEFNLLI